MQPINIDSIFEKYSTYCNGLSLMEREHFKAACIDFANQLLQRAADNAETTSNPNCTCVEVCYCGRVVDKDSILNVLNNVQ